jgi:hypothetical protein
VIKVHTAEWFEVVKNFLKLAFVDDRHESMCPCNRCQNRMMLSEYEMSSHITKHKFLLNYLVWQQYGELHALKPTESDGSNDEDRMDDMIADIGMEYDLWTRDQHPPLEAHNFYKLLPVLQTVTYLMGIKLKYNFLNQWYNDIMKLIIDFILVKHNIPKDFYQSKKIVAGPAINYEKIDVCERNCMLFYEHKNDTECMHCGRFRYVKVLNKDGASVTIKVAVKQLLYMHITPKLKRLHLSEETSKQMK